MASKNPVVANAMKARNSDSAALEALAKKYNPQVKNILRTLKAFKSEAQRLRPTCMSYLTDAIDSLETVDMWCEQGAKYGFDD